MHDALKLELPDPEWLELLRNEIGKGRSIAAVARDIGMARPSLSMLLSGTYPARLDKVGKKFGPQIVRKFAGQVLCPHMRRGIGREECESFARQPMSTSNPEKLRHWSACRRCPLNPVMKEVNDA